MDLSELLIIALIHTSNNSLVVFLGVLNHFQIRCNFFLSLSLFKGIMVVCQGKMQLMY